MKKLMYLLGIIALSFPVMVFANPGTWTPEAKKIYQIIVEGGDGGQAAILIEGGVPAAYIPSQCNSGGDVVYNTTYLNTDKGKSIYSLALSAYLSGKPVKLALSCTGTRPLITHILF